MFKIKDVWEVVVEGKENCLMSCSGNIFKLLFYIANARPWYLGRNFHFIETCLCKS